MRWKKKKKKLFGKGSNQKEPGGGSTDTKTEYLTNKKDLVKLNALSSKATNEGRLHMLSPLGILGGFDRGQL